MFFRLEQAHLAEEGAGAEVGEHDFTPVFVLIDYRHRAGGDVVQGVRRITGIDDHALIGIAAPVAMGQKALDSGIFRRLSPW